MPITTVFAGLLALLFVALSLRVIGGRRSARVALGDGGDQQLARRMRVHANFAEYVPLALVLMAFAELQGAWRAWVWLTGALLLTGRLLHAYGVSQDKEDLRLRVTGMVMTFTAMLTAAVLCLVHALPIALRGGFV